LENEAMAPTGKLPPEEDDDDDAKEVATPLDRLARAKALASSFLSKLDDCEAVRDTAGRMRNRDSSV
jgi:hypothetical protein